MPTEHIITNTPLVKCPQVGVNALEAFVSLKKKLFMDKRYMNVYKTLHEPHPSSVKMEV